MQRIILTPKQVRAGATRRRVPGYRARAASNPSRFSKGEKGAAQAWRAHTKERFNKWRDKRRGKLAGKLNILKPATRGVGRNRPTNRKSVDRHTRAATGMMREVYKRDRKKILSRKPRRASAGVKPRTARDRAGSRAVLHPVRGRGAKATAARRPTKQFKPIRKRPVKASEASVRRARGPAKTFRATKRPVRRKDMVRRAKASLRATAPQRGKNVTRRKVTNVTRLKGVKSRVTNRRGGTGPQRNWAKSTPLIRSAAKKYRGYRR